MTNSILTIIVMILIISIHIKQYVKRMNGEYPKPFNASKLCQGERPFVQPNHFVSMVTANTRHYDDDKKKYAIHVDFSAKHPTILLLNGNNRIDWNIKTEQPKLLKAIVVTGHDEQKINLDAGKVPIYNSKNTGLCLTNYLKPIPKEYSPFLVKYINLPMLEHVRDNGKNRVTVTADGGSNQLSIASVESAHDVKYLMADSKRPRYAHLKKGQDGIKQALKLGLIRPATEEDSKAYVSAYRKMLRREKISPSFGRLSIGYYDSQQKNRYVILHPFLLPQDIDSLFMPSFYLAKGVPYPKGDIEYSAIYDLNDGTCVGILCNLP